MAPLDVSSGPSYGTVDQIERQPNDEEREQLLVSETDPTTSEADFTDDVQEGVRKIEAINLTWTTRSLVIAYVRYAGDLFCC